MTPITDKDARDLNLRVEAALGDDGAVFDSDGEERRGYGPLASTRLIAALHAWDRLHGAESRHSMYRWEHRHGKPGQAELEAYVYAWREPARPFATDDELAMRELYGRLVDQGLQVGVKSWRGHTGRTCHLCHADDIANGTETDSGIVDSIAEAVTRAYLATLEAGAKDTAS